jgi:hypothetical protein
VAIDFKGGYTKKNWFSEEEYESDGNNVW